MTNAYVLISNWYLVSVLNMCWHFQIYWIILNTHLDLSNPSARTGFDTRSIFKKSLTGLCSEFSLSKTGCHSKVKGPSLPIAKWWIVGFIPLPRLLMPHSGLDLGSPCPFSNRCPLRHEPPLNIWYSYIDVIWQNAEENFFNAKNEINIIIKLGTIYFHVSLLFQELHRRCMFFFGGGCFLFFEHSKLSCPVS